MSRKNLHAQSLFLLLFLFLFYSKSSQAQCLTPLPPNACSGTEPLVTNGETIPIAVSKWFYGTATTFSNLTLRGGTLTICGDLTLQNFTMDSGTIFIRSGAKLRIEGGNGLQLFGNCYIYNYGTLQVTRNLSLENHYASALKPNKVINAPGAVFDMLNQYFVINNPFSFFVNKGIADFHGIIVDPGCAQGCVCLGSLSQTSMTVLHNKTKFSYSSPEGIACLSVSEYSQIWDTLTPSASIALCLGPKFKADSSCMPFGCKPQAWGPLQIFPKCNSCVALMVLPVKIYDFSVNVAGIANKLNWRADMVDPGFEFLVERSPDGVFFQSIDTATITQFYNGNQFTSDDMRPLEKAFYRITCRDKQSGGKRSSNMIMAVRKGNEDISIYPNPFTNILYISYPAKTKINTIRIIDLNGKVVYKQKIPLQQGEAIRLKKALPAGVYFLNIIMDNGTRMFKLVKS